MKEKWAYKENHIFFENEHVHTQKSECGRKIKHFLKVGVKKKEKGGRKVDARKLSKSGRPKKKKAMGFFTFFSKKESCPNFPYSLAMIEL